MNRDRAEDAVETPQFAEVAGLFGIAAAFMLAVDGPGIYAYGADWFRMIEIPRLGTIPITPGAVPSVLVFFWVAFRYARVEVADAA
jgi:hypothetical protein